MPVSKKRKRKDGTIAKFKRDRYEQRRRDIQRDIDSGGHLDSGVTLQDLINMVAYQEYREKGLVEGPEIPDRGPMTEEEMLETEEGAAVVRALEEAKNHSQKNDEEENQDGRQ